MDEKQTSMMEFMENFKEQEAEDKDLVPSGEFEKRDKLDTERDVVYAGYFIESYQGDIEGKFGKNTAVRVTSPEGTKLTLWVNGYEEEHFGQFMTKIEKKGATTLDEDVKTGAITLTPPVKVDFMRSQVPSKDGDRRYNKIMFILKAHGEEVQYELDSL
jgi:hypothetical protein